MWKLKALVKSDILFQTKFYISKINWVPLRPTRPALVCLLFSVLISFLYSNFFLSFFFSFVCSQSVTTILMSLILLCVVTYLLQPTYWLPHVAKMCLEEGIKLLFLAVSLVTWTRSLGCEILEFIQSLPTGDFLFSFLTVGGPHTSFPCEPCCKEVHVALSG